MLRVKFFIPPGTFRPDKMKYIPIGSNISILPTFPRVQVELDINATSLFQLETDLKKRYPHENIRVDIVSGQEIIEKNKQIAEMYKNSIYVQEETKLKKTKFTDPIAGFTYFKDPINGLVQVFNPVIVNGSQIKYINIKQPEDKPKK
jgi:hypothetical protein